MKFAIPTVEGNLCMHFGHCQSFAFVEVSEKNEIINVEYVTPPPHEPGVLPKWLGEKKVNVIIAGGMGKRAQDLFSNQGIKVVVGAPQDTPEVTVTDYLSGSLQEGVNSCDH